MRQFRVFDSRLSMLAALAAALLIPVRSEGQGLPKLLIISQTQTGKPADSFVDLAPYLSRELTDTGKFEVVTFKPSLTQFQDALAAGKLSQADVSPPIKTKTAHKLAEIAGAEHLLLVSCYRGKEGLGGDVALERHSGGDVWITPMTHKIVPFKSRAKNPSVLEEIHTQVSLIVQSVTGKPAQLQFDVPARSKSNRTRAEPKTNVSVPTIPPSEPARTESINSAVPIVGDRGQTSKADPNTPSSNEILVNKFRSQGDLANLIVSLRHAVTDKPRDARLRRELVRTYIERGWHAEARDEALRALNAAPGDGALHRLLGDTYLETGEAELAVAQYQAAIKIDPRDTTGYIALGDAWWNLAKADEALAAYADGVKADPKSAVGHRRLARLYAQRSRYKDCIAEMAMARDLTPQDGYAEYAADYAGILGVAESALSTVLAKLQDSRKAILNGTQTREQAFTSASADKKRADDIAGFLESLPPANGFDKVASLYIQAGGFVSQAVEGALEFIETRDDNKDREATLLRLEASKQLAEAGKRLKDELAKRSEH